MFYYYFRVLAVSVKLLKSQWLLNCKQCPLRKGDRITGVVTDKG